MTDAEQNYVAIEGEALAIAWALEQSKYFTLGCEDLLVVTEHKVPELYGINTLLRCLIKLKEECLS